jgi:cell division septation protein DedD
LKDSVQPHNSKPHQQGVLPGSTFRAEIPSTMNFIEGQEASYPVTITSMLGGLTFNLVAQGLPKGVQLVQIDATHFLIKGTVPFGTTVGGQKGEQVPVKISAVNPKGDQTQVHLFNSLLTEWTPTISLYATDKYPMVEAQAAALSVNESESVAISITVSDVGSTGSNVPSGYTPFGEDSVSGEVQIVSARPGLYMSAKPQALGGGRFKFSGTLDTKQLKLPAGKKDVTARILVAFKSPSGLISADEIVDVKIVRAQPAPAPVAAPAAAAPAPAAPAPAAAPAAAAPAAKPAPKPASTPVPKKGSK